MRILIINKFLYPNGGSETYVFRLGDELKKKGHDVQYFGMDHEQRCVGNDVNAYTSGMDFHNGSKLSKLSYPFKTIYSKEARVQIRKVLEQFQPDVCHINNFNYQLTPSIILEIKKWNKNCKIVYTAHDGQLVCPNHLFKNPNTGKICEECVDGHFLNCLKGKCIHGSSAKSAIGMLEAKFWRSQGVYKLIDVVICPSEFMRNKLEYNPHIKGRTVVLHNFVDAVEWKNVTKKEYVLFFGRYSEEKGIYTLLEAAKKLPEIVFVFAGTGPLKDIIKGNNITEVGFKTGKELEELIRSAKFSIYPSEWYENCPFSIMESQMYGTLVLGADIGGIPELIESGKNGELFRSGDVEDLINKIKKLWYSTMEFEKNSIHYDTISEYCEKILELYLQ